MVSKKTSDVIRRQTENRIRSGLLYDVPLRNKMGRQLDRISHVISAINVNHHVAGTMKATATGAIDC